MKAFKKISVVLLVMGIIAVFLFACSKKTERENDSLSVVDECETDLIKSNKTDKIGTMVDSILCRDDFWQALDSCSLIMKKCIESSLAPSLLLNSNETDFCKQIGISKTQYNSINNYVKSVFNNIRLHCPELMSSDTLDALCPYCNYDNPSQKIQSIIEHFKDNPNLSSDLREIIYYSPLAPGNNNHQSQGMHADGGCHNVVNYTLCLLVCTSTGPVLYWICAYLCLCQYCPDACLEF